MSKVLFNIGDLPEQPLVDGTSIRGFHVSSKRAFYSGSVEG